MFDFWLQIHKLQIAKFWYLVIKKCGVSKTPGFKLPRVVHNQWKNQYHSVARSGVLYQLQHGCSVYSLCSALFSKCFLSTTMSQQTAVPDGALLCAKIREIYYLYVLLFISKVSTRAFFDAEGEHNRSDWMEVLSHSWQDSSEIEASCCVWTGWGDPGVCLLANLSKGLKPLRSFLCRNCRLSSIISIEIKRSHGPGNFPISLPGWVLVGRYEGIIIELFPQFPGMAPCSYANLHYLINRLQTLLSSSTIRECHNSLCISTHLTIQIER